MNELKKSVFFFNCSKDWKKLVKTFDEFAINNNTFIHRLKTTTKFWYTTTKPAISETTKKTSIQTSTQPSTKRPTERPTKLPTERPTQRPTINPTETPPSREDVGLNVSSTFKLPTVLTSKYFKKNGTTTILRFTVDGNKTFTQRNEFPAKIKGIVLSIAFDYSER